MDLTTLGTLGIGAAIAALAASWNQVKGALSRLLGLVVMTVEFESGYSAQSASRYISKSLKPSASAFRAYAGLMHYLRLKKQLGIVMYEDFTAYGRLYWRGRVPIWISKKSDKGGKEGGHATGDMLANIALPVVFRFIRGTLNPDALAHEVSQAWIDASGSYHGNGNGKSFLPTIIKKSGKSLKKGEKGVPSTSMSKWQDTGVFVYGRLVGWSRDELGDPSLAHNPLDRLALPPEVEEVVEQIRRWRKSKEWYLDRQIPWRFGVLLHGLPGTGKSALTRAMAQELEMNIVAMDVATMDNEEFQEAYNDALGYAPVIILIEDVDAVFDGRRNVASKRGEGLTFDHLLNTLSGVGNSEGAMLVVTTNDVSKVDPALGVSQGDRSSRPGRIDRVVEMPPTLSREGREKVARRIMGGCADRWIDHVVDAGERDTGAQFEDRCATLALKLFWSNEAGWPTSSEEDAA